MHGVGIHSQRILLAFVCPLAVSLDAGMAVAQETDPVDQLKTVHSAICDAPIVELEVDGAKAFIVKATEKVYPSNDKPWIWYAPSLTNEDGTWQLPSERHAKVVKELLGQGFYFCGVDVGESFGSPKGRDTFTAFHKLLVERYGFSPKACLFPVSRGGLMHYTWAVEHPEFVQCIGGIYPRCSLHIESDARLERISRAYGMTPEQFRRHMDQHNPLMRLEGLAEANVPILHLHGDADEVVPLETNSGELKRRYEQLGGKMEIVVIKGKGHEIVPEYWENPRLADFFLHQGVPVTSAASESE